ncbi:MAG: DUF1629 domain-containing protein [Bacteroidota bacterium]
MKIVLRSVDKKIVGAIPQAIAADPIRGKPTSRPGLFLKDRIPRGTNFVKYILLPKARITDFINCPSITNFYQFAISKKLHSIFINFNGLSFDYAPLEVIDQNKNSHEYYLLNYTSELPYEVIDLPNSTIKILDWKNQIYLDSDIDNYHDLIHKRGQVTSLTLNKDLISGLHHFVVPIMNRLIISDEFAEELVKQSITGMEVYDFDDKCDISDANIRNLPRVI